MKSVLVVDDEFAIVEALVVLLEGEGYRVRTAWNGAEALARLAEEPADLVLSDVMMPVMDGPSLLRAIRADAALAATPVIFMTATRWSNAVELHGSSAVFTKPFLFEDVLAEIERVLGAGP